MMPIFSWIVSGLVATTYGYSEKSCGTEKPTECKHGAVTASGVLLNPDLPQAAIAIPKKYRVRPTTVCLKTKNGKKAYITIIDKMNERFVGNRSYDLTPAALKALGIEPNPFWSDRIYSCQTEESEHEMQRLKATY
jgi:hypothetical protein